MSIDFERKIEFAMDLSSTLSIRKFGFYIFENYITNRVIKLVLSFSTQSIITEIFNDLKDRQRNAPLIANGSLLLPRYG